MKWSDALTHLIRTHFINRHEMRSSQKGRWQDVRRVARLALHPKQGTLALAPIYEMISSVSPRDVDQ
jgi:hypothetical protein